jgi:hypothetical protein
LWQTQFLIRLAVRYHLIVVTRGGVAESVTPFLEVFYGQLLARGVQYFLPASRLENCGSLPNLAAAIAFHPRSDTGLRFEWLGHEYELTVPGGQFTDHQERLLHAIGRALAARYQLLIDPRTAAQAPAIFSGLPEDRFVSAFLETGHFESAMSLAAATDRVFEAIEVLRISALSTYEDKRISTGALLFGTLPDACHSPPARPADALPYSSELTSIRSFHRICDGLRTIALVNRDGLMVELVDVQEWAEPFRGIDLPVPTARRYRTHTQATLCGGHICLVLTPNGEIKIFGEGVQLFSFLDGRWHLTDVAWKYDVFENAIGHQDLANRLFSAALNLAEQRRGGLLVVLDDARKVRQLVSARDLLGDPQAARAGAKDQLHYLLRRRRVTELSPLVLETIAQIDGSIVLDREGNLLAFGAILRHRLPADRDEEIGDGGRTAAAIAASQFGDVLKVSEGGQLSFYQRGRCVWTL